MVLAELILPAAVKTAPSIARTSTWQRRKARLMRVTLQELIVKMHLKKKSSAIDPGSTLFGAPNGSQKPRQVPDDFSKAQTKNARRHSPFLSKAARVPSGTKQKACSFQKSVKNASKLVSRIGTHLAGRMKANSLNRTLTTPLMTPMLWTVYSL